MACSKLSIGLEDTREELIGYGKIAERKALLYMPIAGMPGMGNCPCAGVGQLCIVCSFHPLIPFDLDKFCL